MATQSITDTFIRVLLLGGKQLLMSLKPSRVDDEKHDTESHFSPRVALPFAHKPAGHVIIRGAGASSGHPFLISFCLTRVLVVFLYAPDMICLVFAAFVPIIHATA